ncbi:hypothetical protein O9G_005781 [Rozella allomycis CSF55]|uniref:Phorbol-ester/DAG-type domain-containing protein n=1 Tax=Rozella allomycis (strain CSF55) TaxID=988480 RepID=A0A075AML1_ROZAC|nr:hypothetical protein O9G_005781 [Rozella allomycis CSF55]|eukprot:EPZ30894.1 hypothetical protein O9G_005781 [Rozella allomycis CSF55]
MILQPILFVPLPGKQRRKLLNRLEKYSTLSHSPHPYIHHAGLRIPMYVQYAFPFGLFAPQPSLFNLEQVSNHKKILNPDDLYSIDSESTFSSHVVSSIDRSSISQRRLSTDSTVSISEISQKKIGVTSKLLSKTKNFFKSSNKSTTTTQTPLIGENTRIVTPKMTKEEHTLVVKPQSEINSTSDCHICRHPIKDDNLMQCVNCPLTIHENCVSSLVYPCYSVFKEDLIESSFLKVFTSLFYSFKPYVQVQHDANVMNDPWSRSTDDYFKKTEFLSSCDKNETRFMSTLLDTQMFSQFAYEHSVNMENDYKSLYFYEKIKEKKNRSKWRLSKSSTPFLDDASFGINETFYALQVNHSGLDSTSYCYETFPIKLNPDYFVKGRDIEPLFDEKDDINTRIHTNAIRREARIAHESKTRKIMSLKHALQLKINDHLQLKHLRSEFDTHMQRFYKTYKSFLMPDADLITMPLEDLQILLNCLTVLHDEMIRLSDHQVMVVRTCQEELQVLLKELIKFITKINDHIKYKENRIENCDKVQKESLKELLPKETVTESIMRNLEHNK